MTIYIENITITVPELKTQHAAGNIRLPATEWPEQGGTIVGIMPGIEGHAPYCIILPTDPAAQADDLQWGSHGESIDGLSDWDGHKNTEILVARGKGKHPAAEFCAGLKIGDHEDFYLCSQREASMMRATAPHLFEKGFHWTSTQYSAFNAWYQYFDNGNQGILSKSNKGRVVAVRRVFIY